MCARCHICHVRTLHMWHKTKPFYLFKKYWGEQDAAAAWGAQTLPHKHHGISDRHKAHSLKPKAKAKAKANGKGSQTTPVKKDGKRKAAAPKQTPAKTGKGGKAGHKAAKGGLTDKQRARKNAHSQFWHAAFRAAKNEGKTPEEAKAHPDMIM